MKLSSPERRTSKGGLPVPDSGFTFFAHRYEQQKSFHNLPATKASCRRQGASSFWPFARMRVSP
jgi:hypothetical protein